MKIYKVDFDCMWAVGCCLIIAANNLKEAQIIAKSTILHTDKMKVKEVKIKEPQVIEYLSGDY